MLGRVKKKCKINLALQGGGAYGAFTWGVLKRLLEEDSIELDGFSGTSSGALNAAVLATGLAKGGRKGALSLLESFWTQVGNLSPAASFSASIVKGLKNLMPQAASFVETSLFLSPFIDIAPLRSMVEQHVDCKAIAATFSRFFISATKLSTGYVRIFEGSELSIDALMASACLPYFFKAIEVEGEHYWDGGYSSNPPLLPFVSGAGTNDILIVQLNSTTRHDVPNSKSEVISRMMEISFNAPLISELKLLAEKKTRPFLHRITTQEEMQHLSPTSRLLPEKKLILRLKEFGYAAADTWLTNHFQSIGVECSFKF